MSNPFFKGLGWLGGSFAAGALGAAGLNAMPDDPLSLYVLATSTLILLAYVLLHACILELTDARSRVPLLGTLLLLAQAAAFPVFAYFHRTRQLSVAALGIVVAVQALQSAVQLKKNATAEMLPPMWFNISILMGFAGFCLFRSAAVLVLGTPLDPRAPNPFQTIAAIVFLSASLGLGFGVFWISSTEIRLKLEQLANIDPLTGLCNRRSFLTSCEREHLIGARTGAPFSLIMIDVDDFKRINDRHGHDTGDAVLCAIVGKLRNGVRNIDVLARWGGEEFVALLPGADCGAALIVAERLQRSVESLEVAHPLRKPHGDDPPIRVTISLGVATHAPRAETLDDLFRHCDQAMYQAKVEGRNRVVHRNMQAGIQPVN
ncbi:MAG: GGDEF domain-containing protein [Acidobacteriaceae bacterium]